jgi:hypothetical protein
MSSLQTYPYANLQFTDAVTGKWMLSDCADRDAFARLRVSEPYTLYEGSTIYDSNLIFFDNDLTANASITGPGSEASMLLTVNTTATQDQYAARQTHFYSRYQPGKSFLALFSFSFGAPVTDIVKRVGLYDVDNLNANNPFNGVLLEQSSLGLTWYVYKGDGTFQSATQGNWNVDNLNGSGASGFNLTPLKAQQNLLGFVDLEWLGVGRVRVGFFIKGVPVIVQCFNNIQFSVPYINNPFLPIRYEVRKMINNSNTANMRTICCSILSEGGYEQIGIARTIRSPKVSVNQSAQLSILSLRLSNNFPRSSLTPISLEIASNIGGNATAYFRLYLWRPSSPSIVIPGTWTNVNTTSGGTGSIAEYNTDTNLYTTMSNDVTNNNAICIQIDEGSVSSVSKNTFQVVMRSLVSAQSSVTKANRDIFVVVINNTTPNSRDFSALLSWREF